MKKHYTTILYICFILVSNLSFGQGNTLASATQLTSGTGSFAINNTGNAPNISFSCNNPTGYTSPDCYVAWFYIETGSPAQLTVDFDSNGSDQDIWAVLFSTNDCTTTDPSALTALDCEREGLGGISVMADVAPNRRYYIMVGDYTCDASVPVVNYTMTETPFTATNDEPCTATPLTIGGGCGTATLSDYTETCLSSDPLTSCTNSSNTGHTLGNACRDAWFTYVVPASGSIDITFLDIAGSADITAAAYTGSSCTSSDLSLITCDDDGGVGSLPELNITGQVPGTTIYVRVWEFGCNDDATFEICAVAPPILLNSVTDGSTINIECGISYDFYDSGGPGNTNGTTNYEANEDYTVTFCATTGNNVRLSFLNMFNSTVSTGTNYRPNGDGTHALDIDAGGNSVTFDGDLADYLTFYDGSTTTSPIIAKYTGETLSYPSPGTIVSSGTCLTVHFTSSMVIEEEGWEAKIDCISEVSPQTLSTGCLLGGNTFNDDDYNASGATTIQPDDQYIVTVCPDIVGSCAFAGALSGFENLMLNQNIDYLYVYNGTDDTSSPIAIFTGTGDNDLAATENSTNITGITAFTDWVPANTNGCLTFKLVTSNASYYPNWTTTSGFDINLTCVECDLGNGGGTDCATATEVTQNGFWAGTNIDDCGDGYDVTYNPTGTDLDESSGLYTSGCLDATGTATGTSNITRLENTTWYHFKTPEMCQELGVTIQLNYISCQNERADNNGIQFVLWEGTPGMNIDCPPTGNLWDNSNDNAPTGDYNMIGCFDKLNAGGSISISQLEDNTDYYIMIDGFTGQHCFWDLYIDLFPADIKNIMTDASTSPAMLCSGSTTTATLTAEAMADVNIVFENSAYLSVSAAMAAANRTTAYDNALTTQLNGTPISPTQGTTSTDPSTVAYTITGTDFPDNQSCAIQVYNVYMIADNVPTPFADDDACFPFEVTQIVIYPEPLTVVTDTGTESNCGTPIAILQAADGQPCVTQSGIGIGDAAIGTCTSNGDVLQYDFSTSSIITALAAAPSACATPTDDISGSITCTNCAVATADIGDLVFYDYNNDGIFNPVDGDMPLGGVTVTLYDANTDMPVSGFSTTSDPSGNYLFTDVPAGNYYVLFTPPSGYVTAVMGVGNNQNNIGTSNGVNATEDFSFDGTTDNLSIDAGFTGTGSIGDYVWEDTDGNMLQNESGTGIDGVELSLTEAGADGVLGTSDDITFPNMTTSGGGNYDFTNLPPGNYQVAIVSGQPVNFSLTTNNDPTSIINLSQGEDYNDADFGFQPNNVCIPENGMLILTID